MAQMYSMAQDWTFDQFMEDSRLYHETQYKGVYCEDTSNYRKYFMVRFKNAARDFKDKWFKTHQYAFEKGGRWLGDEFMEKYINTDWFSDFYKDAYGQRPHLPSWFYLQAVGMESIEDVGRRFCATPVESAEKRAKMAREEF